MNTFFRISFFLRQHNRITSSATKDWLGDIIFTMKERLIKRDCPGGKWPLDMAWAGCGVSPCDVGYPNQDKYEFTKHYPKVHPDISLIYKDLTYCTQQEWLDHCARAKADEGAAAASLPRPQQHHPALAEDPDTDSHQPPVPTQVKMNSDMPLKARRPKIDRNDPNFRGYGCYIQGCDFVTTGKNSLSGHLGSTHGLKQSDKELDKILIIGNVDDGSQSLPTATNVSLRVTQNGTPPTTSTQANPEPSVKATPPAKVFLSSSPSAVAELSNKIAVSTGALPSALSTAVADPDRKIAIPVSRVRVKFDHTRLPIFYKCHIKGCDVLGRTPESILKHWKVDEDAMSEGNPTHIGHAWDIKQVYKFIRGDNGEVRVTTHGREPTLPTAVQLDPKNVKQYLAPLSHTNVAAIKIRGTKNTATFWDTKEIWFCNLCFAPIGTLLAVKEHLVDAHAFTKLAHNFQTKMIHFLAAHLDANGESVCHTPDHDGGECGYVGKGEILEHLTDEAGHGLDEDDLHPNEKTGNIFMTVAEVKEE